MPAKRTNGLPRHVNYPSYLIFHFSNDNWINNKFLFLSKSTQWKQIENYGSLIKLLNTLQRNRVNLVFIFGANIDRWSWAYMLYFLEIQTADEWRNGHYSMGCFKFISLFYFLNNFFLFIFDPNWARLSPLSKRETLA